MKLVTDLWNKVKTNKLLILILFAAALLRFIGTNPGYSQYHPDEGISYAQGIYMVLDKTLDAHGYALSYGYPTLVPLINAIFDLVFFIPGSFLIYFVNNPRIFFFDILHLGEVTHQLDLILWTEVFGDRMYNVLHWGRYVTATFSLGVVFLTYLLAKKTFNKTIALLAALLVTFNFRQVLNSHVGLPDIYNCFFLLLSVIFSLQLIKKPTLKNYMLAGLFAGLSFATKFQTFGLVWLVLSHLYIVIYIKKGTFLKRIIGREIIFSLLTFILVPVILNPFHIIHWQEASEQLKGVANKYSVGRNQLNLYPYFYLFHIGIGQFISIISIFGILIFLKRDYRLALWFLIPIVFVFYTFTFYSNGGFYTRNFISITPILLIFAAYCIYQIFLFVEKRSSYIMAFLVSALVLSISIYIPARDSIINSYYYSLPWGYDVILEKTEPILPDNIVIASHPFHTISKTHPFKRIDFEFANSYSFSEFKEQGGQYAYVNMDLASDAFYGWMTQSPSESLKYFNKPVGMLNNTFFGLSINEMMQYVFVGTYKPWQAPDSGLFITKIPELERGMNFTRIKEYDFNDGLQGWYIQDQEDVNQPMYFYDQNQGNLSPGSIKAGTGATKNAIVRISSPEFPIKSGHSYRITGYMNSDQEIAINKRNSFIRADFSPVMSSGVSSRFSGNGWKKYTFNVLAPVNAKALQVSLQNAASSDNPVWLDDILIEESDKPFVNNDTYAVPFQAYRDLLYTNSHGNL